MFIDWKIVINCDTSMHGISDITKVNLCVLTLKNVHVLLSAREKEVEQYLKQNV